MGPSMFDRGSIPTLEGMVHFTAARHRAIAANLANVETPGYRAVDVPVGEFQAMLERAFRDREASPLGAHTLKATPGIRPTAGGLNVRIGPAEDAGILRHIANNVDLDMEMGKLAKNTMTHNLAAAILRHQLDLLHTAIRGRVA